MSESLRRTHSVLSHASTIADCTECILLFSEPCQYRSIECILLFSEPCQYRCVECGCEAVELYKDFKAGIIKISHCVSVRLHVNPTIELLWFWINHLIYTIILLKSVCRCSQTAGHNSCSIVSGDVSNCSYRLTVHPVTSSCLSSA